AQGRNPTVREGAFVLGAAPFLSGCGPLPYWVRPPSFLGAAPFLTVGFLPTCHWREANPTRESDDRACRRCPPSLPAFGGSSQSNRSALRSAGTRRVLGLAG